MLRRMLVIALGALIVSACSSSRQATVSSSADLRVAESRSADRRDSVIVEVHDTLREVTTIHIQTNETGDTVRMSTVTDRDRSRLMADVRSMKEETRVIRDTVYVEKRDSVMVQGPGFKVNGEKARASPVVSALKWVFWIIIGLIGLVIVMKIRSL